MGRLMGPATWIEFVGALVDASSRVRYTETGLSNEVENALDVVALTTGEEQHAAWEAACAVWSETAPGGPVDAATAVAIVRADLGLDHDRAIGAAIRVRDYWAVDLYPNDEVPAGGQVPTVAVETGELTWRDGLEVGTGS